MISALPEGALRTLPERYLSFGECFAYIGEFDLLGEDGQPLKIRCINWTCGFSASMNAKVPLTEIRKVLKEAHDGRCARAA